MGKVANAVASKGSDILGSAAKVFPVTGLPLLAYNAYKGAKDTKKEMDALAAQATPDLPKPPPLATPDATDELVRKARQAARNAQLMARGRKSTFLVPPDAAAGAFTPKSGS